jgi:hypothetical protein
MHTLTGNDAATLILNDRQQPGRSSPLGGIEEFPIFRDAARKAASSCPRPRSGLASLQTSVGRPTT